MARGGQGRGFGLVILLIVTVIVLALTARNWKGMMPSLKNATDPALPAATQAADAPPQGTTAPGQRPIQSSVRDARAKTSAHTDRIKGALQDSSD